MRRTLGVFLCILLIVSMSSCYLSDLGLDVGTASSGTAADGHTYITVDGGDHLNITINPTASSDILAASKSLLSTVSVYCKYKRNVTSFGRPTGQVQEYTSAGSGVIYRLDKDSGDAYVITNYHVVYDSDSNTQNHISEDISLYLYGQESADYAIPATYVGGSMSYDLAVLKVRASTVLMASDAVAVDVADSNKVSVLETAIAVGNPEGNGISATVGHVNVDSEYIQMLGADNKTVVEYRVMRVDTAVNGGNSGGGLYNDRGELIGIVNAKVSSSSVEGIGYAIPSNIVKAVAENIIHYCDGTDKECVYRCILGVTVTTASSCAKYDTETGRVYVCETVKISDVTSAVKGVLKVGDVINSITIDGTTYAVTRVYNVVDAMLNARVGSNVVINVTRDGKNTDVSIPIVGDMLTEYS